MTFQPLPSGFPYTLYEENSVYFFISVDWVLPGRCARLWQTLWWTCRGLWNCLYRDWKKSEPIEPFSKRGIMLFQNYIWLTLLVVETDELAPLPHQDCLCVVLLHVQDERHAYCTRFAIIQLTWRVPQDGPFLRRPLRMTLKVVNIFKYKVHICFYEIKYKIKISLG
jgi:hypothetical protein